MSNEEDQRRRLLERINNLRISDGEEPISDVPTETWTSTESVTDSELDSSNATSIPNSPTDSESSVTVTHSPTETGDGTSSHRHSVTTRPPEPEESQGGADGEVANEAVEEEVDGEERVGGEHSGGEVSEQEEEVGWTRDATGRLSRVEDDDE